MFENDVKMYGTQTELSGSYTPYVFENDVKMYGTQTMINLSLTHQVFENDVKLSLQMPHFRAFPEGNVEMEEAR